MIPSRDRIGQIRSYSRWLQNRLGATVRGMWIPERVWEHEEILHPNDPTLLNWKASMHLRADSSPL